MLAHSCRKGYRVVVYHLLSDPSQFYTEGSEDRMDHRFDEDTKLREDGEGPSVQKNTSKFYNLLRAKTVFMNSRSRDR